MDASLSSKLLTIDGEQARQFRLACRYPGQRKISAGNVARLSLAMQRGTFVQGTSIHFCALPDGKTYLINGNHCMEAVVSCGIPQVFNVVVIPVADMAAVADIYMNFDTHKQRTWQDAVRAQGLDQDIPMAEAVTAALGLVMQGFRYNSTNVDANTDRGKRFLLVRQYEAYAAQMHAAISGTPNLNRRLCLRRAVLGVALETFRYQGPTAADFWGGLAKDDGLAARDPRKTLLRYLLANRAHGGVENFYQSVLNDLQDSARDFIATGVGDERLGLLEWSAPEDADPEDVDALLQANPRVGYGLDLDVLRKGAARAKRLGGQALTGYQTERMCIRVSVLNPALNPRGWQACCDPGDLLEARSRVALCLHLTPDADHATLVAAAVLDDGRVRVETIAEWSGPRAAANLEAALPDWVSRVGPRVVGWFPSGPGAAVAARLADRRREGVRGWPPRGVTVSEIRGEVTAVCMGLAKEVDAGQLAHSGQAMLDAQIDRAEKQWQGSAWTFKQSGGSVDAVYAVAGAVHLARTMPRPRRGTGFHKV
jgi:hypothetical protein